MVLKVCEDERVVIEVVIVNEKKVHPLDETLDELREQCRKGAFGREPTF